MVFLSIDHFNLIAHFQAIYYSGKALGSRSKPNLTKLCFWGWSVSWRNGKLYRRLSRINGAISRPWGKRVRLCSVVDTRPQPAFRVCLRASASYLLCRSPRRWQQSDVCRANTWCPRIVTYLPCVSARLPSVPPGTRARVALERARGDKATPLWNGTLGLRDQCPGDAGTCLDPSVQITAVHFREGLIKTSSTEFW